MNIFYLDEDITKCAQYHCDKHVVKMITEYCQLLSAVTRKLDGTIVPFQNKLTRKIQRINMLPNEVVEWSSDENKYIHTRKNIEYLLSHANNPLTLWAGESLENWMWLKNLAIAVYFEYVNRYGKVHAAGEVAKALQPSTKLKSKGFTRPPLCMPEDCKTYDASGKPLNVVSYRKLYNTHKRHIAQWTRQNVPEWYHGETD